MDDQWKQHIDNYGTRQDLPVLRTQSETLSHQTKTRRMAVFRCNLITARPELHQILKNVITPE
jgi:hypothetical protein